MDPTTVSVTVARPREEVFEYLADIANHAEFTDHFLVDWHLLREDSYGLGAGARFRIRMPLNRFDWGDVSFVEVEAPYRIVERGRTGKFNRIRTLGEYRLTPLAPRLTRVEFTFEAAPGRGPGAAVCLGLRHGSGHQSKTMTPRMFLPACMSS